MRRSSLLLVLAFAACTHTEPVKEAEPTKAAPADAVQALLKKTYAAVSKCESERLADLFTQDAMVFGLGPSDTYNLRDTFLARLAQALAPLAMAGDTLEVLETRPVVGIADGAQSAWLYDLPRVELKRDGVASQWLPRVTAHVVLREGTWLYDALHVSLGVSDTIVFAPDAASRLLPPNDVAPQRAKGSEQLVGLTRRLLEDFAVKLERTTDRDEFVQLGSSPVEVFERGRNFKALVRPQLAAIRKAGYSWRLDGNLRTGLSPDGKSGWAAGNVVLRITSGRKQQVLPPFRTLWIFIEENGVWNLASEHQSLAVKEDERTPASPADVKAWTAQREARRAPPTDSTDAGADEANIGAW